MNEADMIAQFKQKLIELSFQDESFKQELISNPKVTLAKNSIHFPENIEIKVVEETSNTFYLVLPSLPLQIPQEELSDEMLEAVAGGRSDLIHDIVTALLGHGKYCS